MIKPPVLLITELGALSAQDGASCFIIGYVDLGNSIEMHVPSFGELVIEKLQR